MAVALQNHCFALDRLSSTQSQDRLLPSKVERKIDRLVQKCLLRVDELKGKTFFYRISAGVEDRIYISTDKVHWTYVDQKLPTALKQEVEKARKYLNNLSSKNFTSQLNVQEKAKIHFLHQKKISSASLRKLKDSISPLTTGFLSVCIGLEQLLSAYHPIVQALAFTTVGFPIAGYFNKKDAERDLRLSKDLKDSEGIKQFRIFLIEAKAAILGGLLFFISKVLKHFTTEASFGALVAKLFGTLVYPLYIFVYMLEIAVELKRLKKAKAFQEQLDGYLNNPALLDKQKSLAIIRMIKEELDITKQEKRQITAAVDQSRVKSEEKQKTVEEKLEELHLSKVKKLERRIGADAVIAFLDQSDEILQGLERHSFEGIQKAQGLVQAIQKGNEAKIRLYSILTLLATIGLMLMLLFMIV